MGALWEELTDARNELERRRVADADAEKEGSHGTRERRADGAVSYTHLTLPTIYSV